MSTRKVLVQNKLCATCTHWNGSRIPDKYCRTVDYDQMERAKCPIRKMSVLGTTCACPRWEQQFKAR